MAGSSTGIVANYCSTGVVLRQEAKVPGPHKYDIVLVQGTLARLCHGQKGPPLKDFLPFAPVCGETAGG
jgi:hypothetical protein